MYSYNKMLLSNKKEWTIDACSNMDEPQRHYVKWKKTDTKGHILYNFIYMKCPEQGKL